MSFGFTNNFTATHPSTRPRRLRGSAFIRSSVAETSLQPSDLILPIFLTEGDEPTIIPSMPNIMRQPIAALGGIAKETLKLGIPAIAVFPFTETAKRDETGSEALNNDNLVCRAIGELKNAASELGVICDVALDPYTSHGHDGLLKEGEILNDESVEILAKQAIVQAKAGCDVLAPSDMMDGRIGAIRKALDESGFQNKIILSYAVKYASAFYGPFRDAVGAANVLQGDKKTYQMDYANSDEALREVALDIQQGADIVMVKPAGFYGDIIYRIKDTFKVPVFAYQVSGEYAMIVEGAKSCGIKLEDAVLESTFALRRAGASSILTYFATDIAKLL